MVKTIVILLSLLSGLTLISAMNFDIDIPKSDHLDIGAEDYLKLQKLQSLGLEFTRQFENISLSDLEIPNGRAASAQDLQCLTDMGLWMKGISSGSLWSLRMIDAWGSKPAGILYLNLVDLGNYDQCMKIHKLVTSNYEIQGQYCLARLPFLKLFGIDSTVPLKIGVCFPSSCSAVLIDTFLKRVLSQLVNVNYSGELIPPSSCKTSEPKPFSGLTIFTIVLLSIFGALALLATFYDYFICQDQAQLPPLIKIFSIRATSRALFRLTNPKTNPNVIDCLHGIRCMSLFWVVFCHEYLYHLVQSNFNEGSLYNWVQAPFQNFISHGWFSVDSFLFLSGLLVVMISLRLMNKTKGKLNVPMMYLHRYLRLTPLLCVAILVYMQVLPLLLDGPLDVEGLNFIVHCNRNWFWTLLFVQNYATENICLGHTWYLGVDMQLYILSPILLFALYKWGKKAVIATVTLIVLLSVWLFTVMMVKKYSMYLKHGAREERSQPVLYFSTHLHATPWLVGAVFGYFMHINRGKTFKLNRIMVWTGWLLSLAILFACIFSLVPYDKFSGPKLSVLSDSLYYTLTRIAWPLCLCWVVFACDQGYGGMANSFLSSPLWQPLSKLSYAVYIWHIFMQELNTRRRKTASYFSDYEMMLNFWSDMGFTFLISYATYVTVEAPLGGLESLLLSSRRPAAPKQKIEEIPVEKPAVLEESSDVEAAPTKSSVISTSDPNLSA